MILIFEYQVTVMIWLWWSFSSTNTNSNFKTCFSLNLALINPNTSQTTLHALSYTKLKRRKKTLSLFHSASQQKLPLLLLAPFAQQNGFFSPMGASGRWFKSLLPFRKTSTDQVSEVCFIYLFRFGSLLLFTIYTIRRRVVTTRVRRSGSYGGHLQKGPWRMLVVVVLLLHLILPLLMRWPWWFPKISSSSSRNGLPFAFRLCFEPSW